MDVGLGVIGHEHKCRLPDQIQKPGYLTPVIPQEHDLAKVGVEGSSPFARSRFSHGVTATSLKRTIV
jgi:hypothetical protein